MGWTGGCLCGAVRYELASEPFDAGWCHCRTCQLNSGSPAMAFASVKEGDWVAKEGADRIRRVRSSSFGHRAVCGECGTPLYMRVDHQPETVDFSIATLDNPGPVRPTFHIFWSSRVPWFPAEGDLPKHDRFRPDTRGLEGTEPPDQPSSSS
jgi:hypothetical protein